MPTGGGIFIMDNTTDENITLLKQEAKKLIQTHRKIIDNLFP